MKKRTRKVDRSLSDWLTKDELALVERINIMDRQHARTQEVLIERWSKEVPPGRIGLVPDLDGPTNEPSDANE